MRPLNLLTAFIGIVLVSVPNVTHSQTLGHAGQIQMVSHPRILSKAFLHDTRYKLGLSDDFSDLLFKSRSIEVPGTLYVSPRITVDGAMIDFKTLDSSFTCSLGKSIMDNKSKLQLEYDFSPADKWNSKIFFLEFSQAESQNLAQLRPKQIQNSLFERSFSLSDSRKSSFAPVDQPSDQDTIQSSFGFQISLGFEAVF